MRFMGLLIIYFLFSLILPLLLKKRRRRMTKTPQPVFTIPDDDQEDEQAELPQPKAPTKVYATVETEIPGEEGTGKDPLSVPQVPLTTVAGEGSQVFSQSDLRRGFIMAEILGKPKALRAPEEGNYPC